MAARKGMEFAVDVERNTFIIRVWGCYDQKLIEKLRDFLQAKMEEACISGKTWYGIVDFTDVIQRPADCLSLAEVE